MKALFVTAAVLAVAFAKPETYRENEDFQYSRSSSDDGTKSGFYGAQRGNMGGNYERSHNMDELAQHQMGGAVKQIEGELGDVSNTRTGSAYTAANSRGIYGSGRYDLSNLEGRNFQESGAYGNSQSHSALSSQNSAHSGQSSHSSGYSSRQAHDSRYQSTKNSGHSQHSSNLQAAENVRDAQDYGSHRGYHSGYNAQSGYQGAYTNQHRDNYDSNIQTRVIAGQPARVVIRPGSTVFVPIAAQTYDTNHYATAHDENAINSEAEVLSNPDHNTNHRSSNPKHYESSYNYRKQWEKHDTITPAAVPLSVPTENPFPKNSELYDDSRAHHSSGSLYQANRLDSQSAHSSSEYNSQSAGSSQSRYNSGYKSQHASDASHNSNTHGSYNSGNAADTTNHLGNVDSKPKSYQSSYAYHKSWERQGDPYVIYPVPNSDNGQASERLTAASANQGHSSHQYGSHYKQERQRYSQSSSEDCDETGHRRVARSYGVANNQPIEPYQETQNEDLGQQTQTGWGQQSQNLEDLGQQSQNLEDLGQQSQNLEDLSQQSQKLEDLRQYSQKEDLGQHSQNLEELGQQTQNFENGQQTQNNWDYAGYQSQNRREKLEVAGQQAQNNWDNLEDLSQQSQPNMGQHQQKQDKWNEHKFVEQSDSSEDFNQQTQSQWDQTGQLGQEPEQTQRNGKDNTFIGQETQSGLDSLHTFNQHSQTSQNERNTSEATHRTHNIRNRLDGFATQNTDQDNYQFEEAQTKHEKDNFEQQNNWNLNNQDHNEGQQTQDTWNFDTSNVGNHTKPAWEQQNSQGSETYGINGYGRPRNSYNAQTQQNTENHNVETQSSYGTNNWGSLDYSQFGNSHNHNFQSNSGSGSSLQSLWDKLNNFEQVYSTTDNNNDQNVNRSSFSHGYNSQNSYQNSWRQTYDFERRLESGYNPHNYNQFASHYHGHHPWQSTLYDEATSSSTATSTTTSTSTTLKPKENVTPTHSILNLRPQDIGRGDIGDEESATAVTTTTDKPYIGHENKLNSPIYTSSPNNKPYKTPEEIEALSLTKESNKSTNNENNFSTPVSEEDKNNLLSDNDNTLSVLSINQQKRINDQKQYANNEHKYEHSSHTTSTTTSKSKNDTNNENDDLDEQRESQKYDSYNETLQMQSNNSNKYFVSQQPEKHSPESHQKPSNISDKPKNTGFGQGPDEVEQQNVDNKFGPFGQQREDLDQQSENVWEQNLEDFGQQLQTAWRPKEDLQQQSETQQTEIFGRANEGKYQTQDFYNERYQPNNNMEKQRSQKIENVETEPQYKAHVQEVSENKPNVEVLSPPEPTTEKPGFWKSVGGKLSSAKDKVASWFKS